MEDLDFSGKTVLVVGGSSGIGNQIARSFLRRGAQVHVWGTRASAKDYSGDDGSDLTELHYQQVDVSRLEDVTQVVVPFQSLDVLVLAQGVVVYKRAEFRTETFRKVVDINLNSLMACCERFREMLASRKGSITIIISVAAFHAVTNNPAYAASKSGAMALARTLAVAWAPQGIRVNGIGPGIVATKMTAITTNDPERLKATVKNIPLGRLGKAEEIASIALFLASPMAAYIVGQTIVADGGLMLAMP